MWSSNCAIDPSLRVSEWVGVGNGSVITPNLPSCSAILPKIRRRVFLLEMTTPPCPLTTNASPLFGKPNLI